jgi:hypothetical protein
VYADLRSPCARRQEGVRFFVASLVLVALLAGGRMARAQDIEYDQVHTPDELWGWWSIRLLAPLGQEFVPQKARLDVVDVYVLNQDSAAPQAADLFVRIHRGDITGEVLGTSRTVTVAYLHDGPVRFEFDTPVETPLGSSYAIELATAGSAGNPAMAAGPDVDAYPSGRGIVGGTPLGATDMWFRTGARLVAVVPAAWSDIKLQYRD